MVPNTNLLLSGVVVLIVVVAHSILGELKILTKMHRENLPFLKGVPKMWNADAFTFRTLRFVWHIPSVLGVGFAVMLIRFAQDPSLSRTDLFVIDTMGITMLACAMTVLLISKGAHMGWVLFAAAGALCLV